jgi:hypothetical protein
MIDNFDDFCLYVYYVVDNVWKQIAPLFKRPGPQPSSCSDSELLTLALVGECRGWDQETEMLSNWAEHRDLFPCLPSQSRFNRRRKGLREAFNLVREWVLSVFDLAQERYSIIDSLPVAAVAFHHAPRANDDWKIHDASYGKVGAKHLTIYGYKLHLLITLEGVILDALLAPAHERDLVAGEALLRFHTDRIVLGDKAYYSKPIAAELLQQRKLLLWALPHSNYRAKVSPDFARLFQAARRLIETVNSQLTQQFHLELNHAHTFIGLYTRLATKLTAHTLCTYFNYLLGNPDRLHIKSLAFHLA